MRKGTPSRPVQFEGDVSEYALKHLPTSNVRLTHFENGLDCLLIKHRPAGRKSVCAGKNDSSNTEKKWIFTPRSCFRMISRRFHKFGWLTFVYLNRLL